MNEMNETTMEPGRLHTILNAMKDGRLIYLPSGSCYRAVGTDVNVTTAEVSQLLKLGLIMPAHGRGGPYVLTLNGRDRLARLNSEFVGAKSLGAIGG